MRTSTTDHPTADPADVPPAATPSTTGDTSPTPRRGVRRALLLVLGAIAGVLLLGNGLIVGSHLLALAIGPDDDLELAGIPRARAVDDQLWRGRAPTDEGYASLAERGVEVVVDLRAEEFEQAPEALLDELDLELVRMPIRDGQTPTAADVEVLLDLVADSDSPVFVHCGAGVGRTGAIVAAYRVATSDATNLGILWDNLSIGPPSLEQITYALTVDADGPPEQPAGWVKAISRFFDGPRRIWHNLHGDV